MTSSAPIIEDSENPEDSVTGLPIYFHDTPTLSFSQYGYDVTKAGVYTITVTAVLPNH
jgi:hypothetical protein